MNEEIDRKGIYSELGDYHKDISKKWKYYALYTERNNLVRSEIKKFKKKLKIADLGCGEGLLVEELSKKGHQACGIDKNYSSNYVKKGDMEKLPFQNKYFDIVLCLDSLQYPTPDNQQKILKEIYRILKDDGQVILTVPNKRHFAARIIQLFTGKLPITDSKTPPEGDKDSFEYLSIMKNTGFNIKNVKGILPTYFILSSFLITKFPARFQWLLRIINKLAIYRLCFVNYITLTKK